MTRLLLAATLLLAHAATAQPSASVRVSPTTVRVGERVAYTLTLRDAPGRAVPTPAASGGLRAVQQRPTSEVTTQVNGRLVREVTWSYIAFREGPARIGPLRIDLGGGRVLSAAEASVRVEAAAARPARPPPAATAPGAAPGPGTAPGERPDLFARIELSRGAAVVGQQVVADGVLYVSPDLQPRQTIVTGGWDAPGFWREELDVASTVPHPVLLGGRPYEAVTLRRIALFPTRTGRLVLPPMRFAVDFLRLDPFESNDPFAPFFSPFSSGFDERDVETPEAVLAVSALPPGAPRGFGGAVGQFTMSAEPVPAAVAEGDPVQVRITLAGTGNVATLGAPVLRAPPGLDAFRPRDDARIDRSGNAVFGSKTFTHTLVPQGGGRFAVPPAVWSYYDPEAGAYRTLRTDTVRVDVAGAPAVSGSNPVAAGAAAALIADAGWQRRGVPVGILWAVLGTGLGVPALVLAATALVRRRRRTALADTPENRRRNALVRARTRLAAARTQPAPDACAAAERAVHGFLWDRFGLTSSGLDRRALGATLDAAGVPHRDRLLDVLAALDVGQYASALAPPDAAPALAETDAALVTLDAAPDPTAPLPRRVRRRATALAILVLAATAPHAQPLAEADRLFALGTRLVAEGDTAGATAAFAGANDAGRDAGRVSAAAEHAVGTLALAQGDAGRARLHTERAVRIDPLDARVATNAAFARALAGVAPETAAARAWRVVRGVAGPAGLVALALALVYAALGLFASRRRRAAVAVGVLGAVAVSVAVAALSGASRHEGVVLSAVEMRAAPAPDAAAGASLAPGALVRLSAARGAWREVHADGRSGWIPASAVAPL